MARQNINRGTTANDGTGDTLREAARKINESLVELYEHIGGDSDNLPSLTITGSESLSTNGAISLLVPVTVFTSDSDRNMTLADAAAVQSKKLVNTGAGTITVTPTSFANGTSFNMIQNSACEVIWAVSNWYIVGGLDSASGISITA